MVVISLGGSIVAPEGVDTALVTEFRALVGDYLQDETHRMILVVGGGAPARTYQTAFRAIAADAPISATDQEAASAQDWIGIMATRLNAELVRHALFPWCQDPVVYDPTGEITFRGQVLVAAGWKPGFSTDFDAVMLAERFGATTVVNLSNIAQVYSDDPRTNPDATPLEAVTWAEFRSIVGDEWTPGRNLPFDPVATRRAAELNLRVIAAAGSTMANTRAILEEKPFFGTVIGPE
jgi:uridylate kinase